MASGSAQMSDLSCPSNKTQHREFCIGRTVAPESQDSLESFMVLQKGLVSSKSLEAC